MKTILKLSPFSGWVLLLLFSLITQLSFAQPSRSFITVVVAPDHDNWTYKIGENVKFTITILKDGNAIKNCKTDVQVGPEKMNATIIKKLSMENGKETV